MPIIRKHRELLGLDLRASSGLVDSQHTDRAINCCRDKEGVITSRRGIRSIKTRATPLTPSYGLWAYEFTDVNGELNHFILSASPGAETGFKAYVQGTLRIAGDPNTSVPGEFSFTPRSGGWVFRYPGGEITYTDGMTGTPTTPETISNLISELTAAGIGYTYTIGGPGVTDGPIASLEALETVAGNDISDIILRFWVERDLSTVGVQHGSPAKYSPTFGTKTIPAPSEVYLPDGVVRDNVLYLTADEHLWKFDGVALTPVGLPKPQIESITDQGSGSLPPAGTYTYYVTAHHTDAQGNITQGPISDGVTITSAAGGAVAVVVYSFQDVYGGHYALVDGNQTGVTTIAVQAGHSLLPGEYVFFRDRSQVINVDYTHRRVLTTTATSITIEGASVDVNDGDHISTVGFGVWRTPASGTIPGLLQIVPNRPNEATTGYSERFDSGAEGADYLFPELINRRPDPAAFEARYLASYSTALLAATKDTVYFSDSNTSSWPPDFNFKIDAGSSPITGLYAGRDYILVFTMTSTWLVQGSLTDGTFQRDRISASIGCVSHHSIAEVEGYPMWLGVGGVYIFDGADIQSVGDAIAGRLIEHQDTETYELQALEADGTVGKAILRPERATAVYHPVDRRYILSIPAEPIIDGVMAGLLLGGEQDPAISRAYVYDVTHQEWWDWRGILANGGMCMQGKDLFFQTYRVLNYLSPFSRTGTHVYRMPCTQQISDYTDQDFGVEFKYWTAWETGGIPEVDKKFVRHEVFAKGSTPFRNLQNQGHIRDFPLRIKSFYDFGLQTPHTNAHRDIVCRDANGAPNFGIGRVRLKPGKGRAIRFLYEHSTPLSRPFITGNATEAMANYTPEETAKRG